MYQTSLWLFSLSLSLAAPNAVASFCPHWGPAKTFGILPTTTIREASGMAVSAVHPERVYWINDSGDDGAFYYSKPDGSEVVRVQIDDFHPRDTEALSLASCQDGSCLLIGDIGDNNHKRKGKRIAEIVIVQEKREFKAKTKIWRRFKLEFPQGPRNAEAMAVLPSGDLMIVTKELHLSLKKIENKPAGVFLLERSAWQNTASGKTLKLNKIGELPLSLWLPQDTSASHIVTDMAVNPHRNVLGLLTYKALIEIPLHNMKDLSRTREWKQGKEFELVPIQALTQQESVAYLPNADTVMWSSEFFPPNSPIFSMTCIGSVP